MLVLVEQFWKIFLLQPILVRNLHPHSLTVLILKIERSGVGARVVSGILVDLGGRELDEAGGEPHKVVAILVHLILVDFLRQITVLETILNRFYSLKGGH